MVLYWPCAEYKDEHHEELQRLFTYDSVLSKKKALDQIYFWRDVYKFNIVRAWIDITDGDSKETEEVPI